MIKSAPLYQPILALDISTRLFFIIASHQRRSTSQQVPMLHKEVVAYWRNGLFGEHGKSGMSSIVLSWGKSLSRSILTIAMDPMIRLEELRKVLGPTLDQVIIKKTLKAYIDRRASNNDHDLPEDDITMESALFNLLHRDEEPLDPLTVFLQDTALPTYPTKTWTAQTLTEGWRLSKPNSKCLIKYWQYQEKQVTRYAPAADLALSLLTTPGEQFRDIADI